jgi:peptidoglycan/xylan/chitin deacetylase (PgdA/CDA1 family)
MDRPQPNQSVAPDRDGSGGGARGDTGDHRSIEAASGTRPVGWLGAGLAETWNTLDYLEEARIRYVCDWVNDDQPYLFEIGTPPLVSLPYSVQTNDVPAYFEMKVSVPEFKAMLKRQFDTLYHEGPISPPVRYWNMARQSYLPPVSPMLPSPARLCRLRRSSPAATVCPLLHWPGGKG